MSPHDLAQLPPLLIPAPVRLVRTGGFVVLPEPPAAASKHEGDPDLPRGGYRLRTLVPAEGDTDPPVRIAAADAAGMLAAIGTLRQLVRQYGRRLPCLEITDHPAFPTRGAMLDVSRNKVPTIESLEDHAQLFFALKFNHLQLYTEHTFAYDGHEAAWRDYSPVTPDEVRRLDAFCAHLGIELVPNQNCFGHLAHWLRLPEYAHLAETHGDWMFMHWPRSGPFSLCPTDPASGAFVRDLLGQLLPCFSSGLVNIGCDETFDVGAGRSRAEVERRGRAPVYFGFVQKICDLAAGHGRRAMLWADIALSDPDALSMWPRTPGVGADPIGLAWGYEPDARFGEWCRTLRDRGIEAWVCPGTSSWRSIVGRTSERNANLAAAAAARADGATGFLVTDWGDSGHHQHWPVAAVAIAHAAQAAWNPAAQPDPRAISLHVFNDESLAIAGWLNELGDVDEPIRRANGIRNASALWTDLYRPVTSKPVTADVKEWRDAGERLEALERSTPVPRAEHSLLGDELTHTLATARLAVEHALAMREHGENPPPETRARLAAAIQAVHQEHIRLWTMRNRPGGLRDSCSHFERLLARVTG